MLVKKGGQFYRYKTVRVDGAPKTMYEGKVSSQQLRELEIQKEEQALRKQSYHQTVSLLDALDEVRAVNEWIMRAGLLVNHNYYLRRSEIRRLKHEE